jgi:hypothetical protein
MDSCDYKMKISIIFKIMALSILFQYCTNEPKLNNSYLKGQWRVKEAYRNESLTKTLNSAVFVFNDNILETNFMGEKTLSPFKLINNKIILENQKYEYTLKINSKNEMELNTNINETPFRIILINN